MKGLWKYISPFAPDQSGAAAVLYEMNSIMVICDAGGCAGNICGFDEPRWFTSKSAIFSAGLREMDAILGRDDRLVDKLVTAAATIKAEFASIIGTPVPAVIGTDYQALGRLAEKRLSLPVITVPTTGMAYYDEGAAKTYVSLFQRFAEDTAEDAGKIGVLGAIPLDIPDASLPVLRQELASRYDKLLLMYGREDGLKSIRQAGQVTKNIVLSPTGYEAACFLQERFGTPFEPFMSVPVTISGSQSASGKVLVIHQQVLANAIRTYLRTLGVADITVASWFKLVEEWQEEQDVALREEDQFIDLVHRQQYDVIIGDSYFKRALPDFTGTFIDVPHFAVSGRI